MKRRTNLFYTSGPDSKFLTFSNYTEFLTGNFLSTNYKMFPSKFLCLKIPKLNNQENKTDFIKNYLVLYYENKLAFLREDAKLQNKNVEISLCPLEYLLDCIYKYDPNFEIPYIGSITEQDYNGTYTDSICIIDMNDYKCGVCINREHLLSETTIHTAYTIDLNQNYLVEWNNNELTNFDYEYDLDDPSNYYDNINENNIATYNYESTIDHIEVRNNPIELNNNLTSIEFNCIIPLFDIVEINKDTNDVVISDTGIASKTQYNNNSYNVLNIPLGIWINENNYITLERDINTNQYPSWSLLISSQFKSLPYIFKDKDTPNDNIVYDNSHITNEFSTFAQILSRQNSVMNNFNDISKNIIEMSQRIKTLEEKITHIESIINNNTNYFAKSVTDPITIFDRVKTDMLEYQNKLNNMFTAFKEEVNNSILNLKWQKTL